MKYNKIDSFDPKLDLKKTTQVAFYNGLLFVNKKFQASHEDEIDFSEVFDSLDFSFDPYNKDFYLVTSDTKIDPSFILRLAKELGDFNLARQISSTKDNSGFVVS